MRFLYLFIIAAFICSCNNETESKYETGTTSKAVEQVSETADKIHSNDSMCYLYTSGKNSVDTYAVRIIINNNHVSGKMMYLYYEKDWRMGNLSGTLNGNTIDAVWTFMQEGMKDSTNVSFKIDGDKLVQKRPAYDAVSGREYLPDTATYSQVYNKVDCGKFPKYDFDLGM